MPDKNLRVQIVQFCPENSIRKGIAFLAYNTKPDETKVSLLPFIFFQYYETFLPNVFNVSKGPPSIF